MGQTPCELLQPCFNHSTDSWPATLNAVSCPPQVLAFEAYFLHLAQQRRYGLVDSTNLAADSGEAFLHLSNPGHQLLAFLDCAHL